MTGPTVDLSTLFNPHSHSHSISIVTEQPLNPKIIIYPIGRHQNVQIKTKKKKSRKKEENFIQKQT